jgi:hypothetical protein
MAVHFAAALRLNSGPPPLLGTLPPHQAGGKAPRGRTLFQRPFHVLVLDAVGIGDVFAAQRVAAFFVVLAAGAQRPDSGRGRVVFMSGATAAEVEGQRRRRVQLVSVRGEHVVDVRGGDPLLEHGQAEDRLGQQLRGQVKSQDKPRTAGGQMTDGPARKMSARLCCLTM